MYQAKVTIVNKTGLHARPASEFVMGAKKFASKITVKKTSEDEEPVNAKSIVRILTLAAAQGDEVEITAEGEDEKEAVTALTELITSGFGE